MAITCREAIEEAFANVTDVLTTSDVVKRIYAKYPDQPWKQVTISDHLIGLSVNHTSSKHYPSVRKHAFLFSLGNGRYRRWNPDQDGMWEVTEQGVQLVDSSEEAEVAKDITDLELAAVDTSLSLERDLEKSLLANLGQLEPNLRLYQAGATFGQQLATGKVGRLDILGVDQNDDFVVIELKAGKADERACGQILRYMGWVKENLVGTGNRKVRGIIVANDFSESLRYAARAMTEVVLKKYGVHFEFTDV